MPHQIFKNKVPNESLFMLLDSITQKTDKYYLINNDVFKRGIYNQKIPAFFEEIKSYYHVSKQKYVEKKLTYNSFVTVLRQICNHANIKYTSQIKYDKSNYDIYYYIYFDNESL